MTANFYGAKYTMYITGPMNTSSISSWSYSALNTPVKRFHSDSNTEKYFWNLSFVILLKYSEIHLILLRGFHFIDLYPETNEIYKIRFFIGYNKIIQWF